MRAAMFRRLLITGCARASTGYCAQLFTRLGLACGHEALFHPGATRDELAPAWPESSAAESSWLAVPFVEQLPSGTVVVHVVRDPERALASLWRIGLFRTQSIYRAFAERHCAALRDGTPMARTARYWTHWNALAERASERTDVRYLRVRAGEFDASTVQRICGLLERDVEAALVRHALASTPSDFNTAGERAKDASVDWSALAGSAIARELSLSAQHYGFEAPDFRARLARSGPCVA